MNDEIYEDIKFLDKLYNRNIIKLNTYFALKSGLIDYYLNINNKENTEDLPF